MKNLSRPIRYSAILQVNANIDTYNGDNNTGRERDYDEYRL